MTLTPPALAGILADILQAHENLDTPYRALVEGRVMRPAPGPRAPVSASVLEAKISAERTLKAIVSEYAELVGTAAPKHRTVPALIAWLGANKARLAPVLQYGDVLDLEILRDQLVRLTGIHDDAAESAVALAEARRVALPGASHYGTSREIARLATAAGRRVSHTTVTTWAQDGHVDMRAGLYSLDDVLLRHDMLTEEPDTGDETYGSSRDVEQWSAGAGCPVGRSTIQRWAAAGHVRTLGDRYSLDDVLERYIETRGEVA